jgi:fumarylacetoacetate (FAA) hydrolase
MKLASLEDGRDDRPVVVSKDLSRCASAAAVAPTLQAALDDWDAAVPGLMSMQPTAWTDRLAGASVFSEKRVRVLL